MKRIPALRRGLHLNHSELVATETAASRRGLNVRNHSELVATETAAPRRGLNVRNHSEISG
ncbi:hypothetical protein [Streptomyces cinereoruber]|uniref:hypothetical protein n=1 Tax=Streptomyces cinereoruber TaxID=67260 RepID=UPI00363F7AF2